MSQKLPSLFGHDSPDELLFLLDSLIRSPLCPHTKEWICYSYLSLHRSMVFQKLNVLLVGFLEGRAFVKYGHSLKARPLELAELASHIKNLDEPGRRVMSLEQVQLWRLSVDKSMWRDACSLARNNLPGWSSWLAMEGLYTIGDYVRDRSFTYFIEMHWLRLLSQSKHNSFKKHWQHSRYPGGSDRCRCPGREIAPLLQSESIDSLNEELAEAVMKEIMSYFDSRILLFMGPDLQQLENSRRKASNIGLEVWYTPESPARRWKYISKFKALASVADRLVEAFQSARNNSRIMSMAQAQLDEDCESLVNRINAR